LHLADKEGVTGLEVNKYISGALIQFILDSNHFEFRTSYQRFVDSLHVLLVPDTSAPKDIQNIEADKVDSALLLVWVVFLPEFIQIFKQEIQKFDQEGLSALSKVLCSFEVCQL
jgi:hypothetical protein